MLHTIISQTPLPEHLNSPYYYQPHPLCIQAAKEVQRIITQHTDWQQELINGKMFGILIVKPLTPHPTSINYLMAYSGQILGRSDWEGFVPAVFDYLQPDGHFKTEEHEIDKINLSIRQKEQSPELHALKTELREAEQHAIHQLESYRKVISESKARRTQLRKEGKGDPEAMIRESQFQKAELRRLKTRLNADLQPFRDAVQTAETEIYQLRQERKRRSDALQHWLFQHFVFQNAKGEMKNLQQIFTPHSSPNIPSGAGECCAPKLLQYAFQHGYTPIAMAEFWWGNPPKGEIRHHLDFYPACQGKCRPILDFMLQGLCVEPSPLEQQETNTDLQIIYEDPYLIAINKPAGMLSVPGKGPRLSAQKLLGQKCANAQILPIHRLDMQTSGVLLFAKTEYMQRMMRTMFECRQVKKTYIAMLEDILHSDAPKQGTIDLPLIPDYINRPRQKVDRENGKSAITIYNIVGVRDGHTLLQLHPQTGRTHQLRVHCSHPDGLGIPILGDDLYGHHAQRLFLHAREIEFVHPITHKQTKISAQNLDF